MPQLAIGDTAWRGIMCCINSRQHYFLTYLLTWMCIKPMRNFCLQTTPNTLGNQLRYNEAVGSFQHAPKCTNLDVVFRKFSGRKAPRLANRRPSPNPTTTVLHYKKNSDLAPAAVSGIKWCDNVFDALLLSRALWSETQNDRHASRWSLCRTWELVSVRQSPCHSDHIYYDRSSANGVWFFPQYFFSRIVSQPSINSSPLNFHTSFGRVWGQASGHTFENFYPTPKNCRGKTVHFADRCQLLVRIWLLYGPRCLSWINK